MQDKFFTGFSPEGFHKLSYLEWGSGCNNKKTVVCVHGNSRNKSDFTFLANGLSQDFRVAAIDLVGRGKSDWLKDKQNYSYRQYISDISNFISRLDVEEVFWIGSSMGGLLGMMVASLPNSPINKLIINDIGPYIPKLIADRIKQHVGIKFVANSFQEGAEAIKKLHASIGIIKQEHWDHIIKNSLIPETDGTYTMAYDPSSGLSFVDDKELSDSGQIYEDESGNVLFWSFWDKISCPVMIIHGEKSELLPLSIITEMKKRGPRFDYYCVKGLGHAPALMDDEKISIIRKWLLN